MNKNIFNTLETCARNTVINLTAIQMGTTLNIDIVDFNKFIPDELLILVFQFHKQKYIFLQPPLCRLSFHVPAKLPSIIYPDKYFTKSWTYVNQ